MTLKSKITTHCIRSLMIIFWVVVIITFLFSSKIPQWWSFKKTINIMTWTDMIDPSIIAEFERQTGSRVNVSYFDSNEELLVKLIATQGQGYDLILPSDFIAELLIKQNLLQPLDRSKLTILDRIDTRLTHQYYDPEMKYCLPYYCALYGLGINAKALKNKKLLGWQFVFDPAIQPFKISMVNNAREAILIASHYLFGSINDLTPSKMNEIKNLLLKQKKWVEAYTDLRADYLLSSGTCPVVVSTTPFLYKVLLHHPELQCIIPSQGSFMVIDVFAIPRLSKKQDLVYQFINFLYQPEIIKHHFNKYTFFPATVDLVSLLHEVKADQSIINAHSSFSRIDFFRNVITDQQINDVWLSVKAQ